MGQILTIISAVASIVAAIFGRNKRKEDVQKIQDKQQEVNYQSQVEEVLKKVDSKDEKESSDALDSVRVLLAE